MGQIASVFRFIAVALILCVATGNVAAQTFDLRPKITKDKNANKKVLKFLDDNDVAGMRKFLMSNKEAANCISRVEKSARGVKTEVPLLFDAVERVLTKDGLTSPEMCQAIIDAGCDLNPNCKGTAPIYLLMDFFATHPKSQCSSAMQLLKAFASRSDWDANLRYRSKMPPLNYLIRTNYEFLGNKFDSEYIADEVLTIMIEHGASITSYNQDGQSLMNFALDTENKYLQDYLIKNGVNLLHQDKKGNDAVHHVIEQGDVALLKKMVAQRSVSIDVNSFHNDTKQLSENHPEMYDFIANNCATKATDYDDITLFRSKFPDKKNLVQNKYEQLANAELNMASSFDKVITIQKRYPDLETVIENKKKKIYQLDCNRVMSIYNDVLSKLQTGSNMKMSLAPEVNAFISTYKDKYNYDPDNKLPLLVDLKNYFTVCDALKVSTNHNCVDFSNDYFFGDRTNLRKPIWNDTNYHRDHNLLSEALSICTNSKSSDFNNFFTSKYPGLKEMYNNMESNFSSSRRFYSTEKTKYEEEKYILERKLNDELSRIDASNIKNYVLKEEGWYRSGNWIGDIIDEMFDFEKDEEVYCTVTFRELTSSKIKFSKKIYYNQGKFSVSTGLFSSESFSTYHDILCFLFLKQYSRSWRNNML